MNTIQISRLMKVPRRRISGLLSQQMIPNVAVKPGTGKTHELSWPQALLVALALHAQSLGMQPRYLRQLLVEIGRTPVLVMNKIACTEKPWPVWLVVTTGREAEMQIGMRSKIGEPAPSVALWIHWERIVNGLRKAWLEG